MVRVIDEEEYLAQNGASALDIGDSALHVQPGSTEKSRARLANAQAAKDHVLLERRAVLRREYRAKVELGTIRPRTERERRIDTANGHPDRADTQAARRLLTRRGITWNHPPT